MSRPVYVVVLAGGEGKRMKGPVTKVLVELLGRPIIGHVLDQCRALSPKKIVLVGGRHLPAMKAALAAESDVVFALQKTPRGTAHAVKQALPHMPKRGADVVILCGDVPLVRGASLKAFLASHRRKKAAVSVASAIVENPTGLGRIVRGQRNRFEAIVEERDATDSEREICEINAGQYVVRVEDLHQLLPKINDRNSQREFYLTDLVRLAAGKSNAWPLEDPIEARGINQPSEYREAYALLRERIFKEIADEGAFVVDPALTHIEVGVKVGFGAVIHPFSVLRRGVTVAARCVVGPFAHLRDGTQLSDGAQVGSFVEVKASQFGPESRALHLAYLGDCVVGASANVGAGTVTANFDGQAKHETVIGEGASLGAGTLLVAPVTVGPNGRTGAGAVVPAGQDVPAGATVVGVPAKVLEKRRSPRKR